MNNKYEKSSSLPILGLAAATAVGSFVAYDTENTISKKKETYSSSTISKNISSYSITSVNYKSDIKTNFNISIKDKAIEIAKKNVPYPFEDIEITEMNDELGMLTTIDVFVTIPDDIDDELLIVHSQKATSLINSNNFLVRYL